MDVNPSLEHSQCVMTGTRVSAGVFSGLVKKSLGPCDTPGS